jgi:hypothetical protein
MKNPRKEKIRKQNYTLYGSIPIAKRMGAGD